LPDPELNPLLNPLLAAHMGRWAEVYFTSPPEKREQAVAELVRELQNNSPEEFAPVEATNDRRAKDNDEDETGERLQVAHAAESPYTCSACGYKNSADQNFCGMCGAPLQVSPEPRVSRVAEPSPTAARFSEPELFPDRNLGGNAIEPGVGEHSAGRSSDEHDSSSQDSNWPLPEHVLPHFAVEPEPGRYRYRIYVGAALTILLVTLVYMAWRGTKAISGTAGPESVPSKVIQPAPAATALQPKAMPSSSSASNPSALRQPGKNRPVATRQKNEIADAQPASRIVTRAASSSAIAPEQSGAQDLATAQKYLNGTQGSTRDSREAALWLWKAVGKGNPTATLALSDLYLRGDGVPKSCDQARLLLDAAARKGTKAAGQRLRNLQAFGCE
jgi:hypothetical protein